MTTRLGERIATALASVQIFLEILGGCREVPETWSRRGWYHLAWGVWWAFLFMLFLAFSGRSTKFVYIDF